MTTQQARSALKQAIRDKMLSLEETELAVAKAHYESFLHQAELDNREGHDLDDLVVSRENAELAEAFDHPVHTHQAKIDAIENIDFSVTDTVRPGAIVAFNNRHFVVAVSTTRFECDGTTYMGISEQSPIYGVIAGMKAGEVFTHNGREFTLDDVI